MCFRRISLNLSEHNIYRPPVNVQPENQTISNEVMIRCKKISIMSTLVTIAIAILMSLAYGIVSMYFSATGITVRSFAVCLVLTLTFLAVHRLFMK